MQKTSNDDCSQDKPAPKIVFTSDDLPKVAQFLQAGGVLAYPSESVWGIGCDAFCLPALQQVFSLKTRDAAKGLIVLTDRADRLDGLFDERIDGSLAINKINSISTKQMLANARATSWVVPIKQEKLPSLLTGDFTDLAVRVTPHAILQKLCALLVGSANPYGLLVSTSCNVSGLAPATSLAQAYAYFGDAVGYLDCDGLGFNQPSQIIDLLTGKILR